MPQITKILNIDITPEKYIQNCSIQELIELEILINSPEVQNKINLKEPVIICTSCNSEVMHNPSTKEYYCTNCETAKGAQTVTTVPITC